MGFYRGIIAWLRQRWQHRSWRSAFYCVIFVVLAILQTLHYSARFKYANGLLLQNCGFVDGLRHWNISPERACPMQKSQGRWELCLANNGQSASRLSQSCQLPPGYRHVRVSTWVKAHQLHSESPLRPACTLELNFYDAQGNMLPAISQNIGWLDGTRDWRLYDAIFQVPEQGKRLKVSINNNSPHGELWIADCYMVGVSERKSYLISEVLLLCAWMSLLAVFFKPMLPKLGYWRRMLFSAYICSLYWACCYPGIRQEIRPPLFWRFVDLSQRLRRPDPSMDLPAWEPPWKTEDNHPAAVKDL